jgi:2'-5' RNA ligase
MSKILEQQEEDKMESYSLWLRPVPGKVYQDAIKMYDEIGFPPHVTLCPSFQTKNPKEVEHIARKIAKRCGRVRLEFKELDHSKAFFKCVFVRLKSTGSLMRATAIARNEIASSSIEYSRKDEVFDPHISIAYGERPRKERERIVSELKKMFEPTKTVSLVSSLIVVCTTKRERYSEWTINLEVQITK